MAHQREELAMKRCLGLIARTWFALVCLAQTATPQDRETKVRDDKRAVEADDRWIYNDLPRARAEAEKSGQPLLVVFRCIPCEACSRFDDLVVKRDERIGKLMDRFVCVRIVQANDLDLATFQFDYDQSFHAFFMHADGAIYGRFGTRSENHDEFQDMTMEGFASALEGVLDLHAAYPANRETLSGKHGPPPAVSRPEEFPTLASYGKKLDYEGNVVKSCMHCHQVRDAERETYRTAAKPMPDKVLYPYPLPRAIGLRMDPKQRAKVAEVAEASAAKGAGLRPGDEFISFAGQPILSIADIQWVLHNAEDGAELPVEVLRGKKTVSATLALEPGWRRRSDISWRPTTWNLRRMGTGGLVLEDLSDEVRRERKLGTKGLALLVKYVGQYDAHAAGKNAGFQQEDILIEMDGQTDRRTETGFLDYALNEKKPGDKIAITVLRAGNKVKLMLPMQ
jgi:hypothetical protein